jgi:hypothetical protein
MDILRPPPGQQDDEAPPPPRNRFLRFVFAALFLVIGMLIFFVGGLVVRNPELPNFLLDQIVRRFQGETSSEVSTNPSGHGARIKTSETPPPAPTTAEEYLSLMNYDENILSPDERTIVSILNEMVPEVLVGSAPTERFSQEIFPALQNLKPGDDVTKLRSTVQECRDLVSKYVRHCQDGAVLVEAKLTGTGLTPSMAHDIAEAFSRRPLTNGTLYWPDEFNKACDAAVRLVDILSKNPAQWKRGGDGQLFFLNQALFDQYNATSKDLNTALRKATYGSGADKLPSFLPRTVNECLGLTNYSEDTLPPKERAVASVLNQTISQLSDAGLTQWSSHLGEQYNNQVATGLNALKPGGDDTKIRNVIAEFREKANAKIKFYQELPEQLAAKLIAAGIPASLAHETAETFAERVGARKNISWAVGVNLLCDNVTKMLDLLKKDSSKWKRNSEGQLLSSSQAFIDQLNAITRDLNSAMKTLNGG